VSLAVVPFSADEHLGETIEVLLRVRAADPTYPPPADVDKNAESFGAWLLNTPDFGRWVALVDGQVAGHVVVTGAHAYLSNHLSAVGYKPRATNGIAEVAKLFVDPSRQHQGVGSALFATACAFAWDRGMQPALAVVVTSYDAVRFYQREGMRDIGSFSGTHGENRVLVHEIDISKSPAVGVL
jgi:GNAT superfamily N-acetyltransferase